ncbi:Mitochondrial intermembrane space import and assembly protein like [Verticillium longisporum]|nr:Mitochondrial intermembrane space import and assembly protein like [Verticillium longisporum]
MYRHTVRSAPRAASALRQTTLRSAPRRFASTAPADKPRTWKGSALRWGLAVAAVYYYNTSPIFADEPAPRTIPAPSDFAASDLKTVDAVIEEKRQKTIVKPKEAAPAATPAAPIPSSETASEQLTAAPGSPEALEQEAGQQGAFNPETGEINWDCPCLGGMADGPCGEDFKTAFSCFVYSNEDPKGIDCIEKFHCFVYSTEEPKGIDCIEKFQGMQDCFKKYPEIYDPELSDDREDEPKDRGMQDCFKKYPEIYDPELSDDREDEPVADGNAGASHEPEVAAQNQTTETIAAKVNDAVEKTTEKAGEVVEKTKVKVADVKEKVIEKATEAKDKVSTKSKSTQIQSADDTDPKQADEAIKADIKPAFSDATAANDEAAKL